MKKENELCHLMYQQVMELQLNEKFFLGLKFRQKQL